MKIKEKPGVYIGKPSLERLKAFLDGYLICLWERGEVDTKYPHPLDGLFDEYIHQRYKLNTDHNWADIIQFYSITEKQGFELFYEHLDEFLLKYPDVFDKK